MNNINVKAQQDPYLSGILKICFKEDLKIIKVEYVRNKGIEGYRI